jgi:hypothetical protein
MKKTIKYVFASMCVGALIAVGACSDDKESLPKIDGYNNSDEVRAANLVAHWTFDDTYEEDMSGAAPTTTVGTVSFVDGPLGKAADFNRGAMVYPTIAAINTTDALGNFSVSLWVNIRGQKRVVGGGYQVFFGIIPDTTGFWGSIMMTAEAARHLPNSDTLELKNFLETALAGGGLRGEDNVATRNNNPLEPGNPNDNGQTGAWFLGGQDWVHYVATWEGATGFFKLYANGQDVGGYTKRGTTASNLRLQTPVHATFGSMAASDLGFQNATRPDWAPMLDGTIDDTRVFNAVLTQAEATALYNLGLAGR